MQFPRFIIGLTAGMALSAQAASIDEYVNQFPAGASLAFMAQKVGISTLEIDYHSQQMALPANTQEVITALAALLQSGPGFHFTTTLEIKGSLDDDVLKGDLIARSDGDPTLRRQNIHNMVATLKRTGVQHIEDNVLIDTSVFASYDKAPGWPWNNLAQCFNTPLTAAVVNRSCSSVSLYGVQKPGDLAFIRVASYYPATILSRMRTLARGSTEARCCELDVVPGDLNHYTLTGYLPQRSEPLPLAFAIQDGASYAGVTLKAELTQTGTTYSGTLLRQTLANGPGMILATTRSAPLHDPLRIILKRSDNMTADTVFRAIGHTRFGVPGTWRAESDVVCQILRQQAGVDLSSTIIADGSGLPRHNLIAPTIMTQVLQYIAQHDTELSFISMLPLTGRDGSLQCRADLHQTGVGGKVSTETGPLQGVYNPAGFITTASGQEVAFVQYLSGYAMGPADQRNRRIPLVCFENRLYKDLYQNN